MLRARPGLTAQGGLRSGNPSSTPERIRPMSTATLDRFPDLVVVPCFPLLFVLGLAARFLPGSPAYGGASERVAARKVARPKKPHLNKAVTSKSSTRSGSAALGGASSVGKK